MSNFHYAKMKTFITGIIVGVMMTVTGATAFAAAAPTLAQQLQGKILLAVNDRGKTYYVHSDGKRYRITRETALEVFRKLSLGISDADLSKIPEGSLGIDPETGKNTELRIEEGDHVQGSADAKVTLYEWSDFECPFCSRFHPTMNRLMSEYEGRVRWVYRHYPLSFHPNAMPAANAAECAAAQGRFWEYAELLYANQTQLGDSYYATLATQLGLDTSSWKTCYDAARYQTKIDSQINAGVTTGVTGTPVTVIVPANGASQIVPGAVPYDQLKALVDSALATN